MKNPCRTMGSYRPKEKNRKKKKRKKERKKENPESIQVRF